MLCIFGEIIRFKVPRYFYYEFPLFLKCLFILWFTKIHFGLPVCTFWNENSDLRIVAPFWSINSVKEVKKIPTVQLKRIFYTYEKKITIARQNSRYMNWFLVSIFLELSLLWLFHAALSFCKDTLPESVSRQKLDKGANCYNHLDQSTAL